MCFILTTLQVPSTVATVTHTLSLDTFSRCENCGCTGHSTAPGYLPKAVPSAALLGSYICLVRHVPVFHGYLWSRAPALLCFFRPTVDKELEGRWWPAAKGNPTSAAWCRMWLRHAECRALEAFCQHRDGCAPALMGESQEGEVCGPLCGFT